MHHEENRWPARPIVVVGIAVSLDTFCLTDRPFRTNYDEIVHKRPVQTQRCRKTSTGGLWIDRTTTRGGSETRGDGTEAAEIGNRLPGVENALEWGSLVAKSRLMGGEAVE